MKSLARIVLPLLLACSTVGVPLWTTARRAAASFDAHRDRVWANLAALGGRCRAAESKMRNVGGCGTPWTICAIAGPGLGFRRNWKVLRTLQGLEGPGEQARPVAGGVHLLVQC